MDFSELADNIRDFFSQRQKALLVSCILIIFFCAALIALMLIPQKKTPAISEYHSEPLEPDQELLLPQGSSVPSGYAVSRSKKDKWNSDEIMQWWTEPDAGNLERIERANDRIIDAITEAAP